MCCTNRGCSQIREVKNVGGFDTVGVAVGPPEIEQRFVSELSSVLGRRRVLDAMPSVINYNDCNQPWWNPISSYESDTEQQDRVLEFINYARYCDFKTPVFVGHSLFFKAFYSRRVSKLLATYRPELAENMRKYRLSNATLLAVHVLFSDDLDGDALILDADILFDGGFHHEGHKQRGQEEDGEPILSASTSGKQHSGNAFLDLSRFSDFGSNFDKIAIRDVVPSSMKDYIPDFKSEIKSFSKKFMGSFS